MSLDLITEDLYTYYLDNEKTTDHRSVIFGLRELTTNEVNIVCSNDTIQSPPMVNERTSFTSNYSLRMYTSGCYYLDENQRWQSDGLIVGSKTNHYETQCFSTHLTTFASGFNILPAPNNWNYVFTRADFTENETIYSTVFLISILYLLSVIYARKKDQSLIPINLHKKKIKMNNSTIRVSSLNPFSIEVFHLICFSISH